jgi:hypothetical protein
LTASSNMGINFVSTAFYVRYLYLMSVLSGTPVTFMVRTPTRD